MSNPIYNPIYYAGIGSRKTPEPTLERMFTIGQVLARHGATLRSGGALGADTAFEMGCDHIQGTKQIFLPWFNFNRRNIQKGITVPFIESYYLQDKAYEIAAKHHPNWSACSEAARKMHMRNVAQILGPDLKSPSKFVICYTPNGNGTGGTGQALRITKSYNIPVFDLGKDNGGDDNEFDRLNTYCEQLFMPEITDPQ